MYYSDVAGQEEIKKSMVNSIINNKVSHCYIFEGPKDMGKYDLAKVFAQSLLCSNFKSEPCNKCNNCLKVISGNHPDLHLFDKEGTIKKEDIDLIIESVYKKPYESSKKVFIIKNAQDMTIQAANTFLKTLEEPPGDSVIVLLTDNINMLLTTIVSRSQVISFKNINKEKIKDYLIKNFEINEEKSGLISNYSNGNLNKAINIASGKDNILEFRSEIINIFDKIIKSDSEIIFKLENYFEENKDKIDIIIEIMMIWIRDILFVKNNINNLVINEDFAELAETHGRYLKNDNNLIEYLQKASENIRNNVNYKLTVDKLILKIQEVFKYD